MYATTKGNILDCNFALFVCMSTLNSETIRAMAIKLGRHMSYICAQLVFALELDHAPSPSLN